MERWSVRLADDNEPGVWAQKRVLMVPGLNHGGLVEALSQCAAEVRYADPIIYFALPSAPGVGRASTLGAAAGYTLTQVRDYPYNQLFPTAGTPQRSRSTALFEWADVLAGDIGSIRRYAPDNLRRKTVVVSHLSEADIADLKNRGVSIVVTTLPRLGNADLLDEELAVHGPATFEACLAAVRPDPTAPLAENTYLNLLAELRWRPGLSYLQPEDAAVNRFSFVIHPLTQRQLHTLRPWTRFIPGGLLERAAAHIPPTHVSNITGIQSPTTGQKAEGILFALGTTTAELMRREPDFAYRRLIRAARMSERLGARIMGLGAFTSVIGDAGVSVAQKVDIAITSGNSLTVAATLETAKQALPKMGKGRIEDSHVLVLGATGTIGSVCSRLLGEVAPKLTLIAPRPEKLIALKQQIEAESPGVKIQVGTAAEEYLPDVDLVVTTITPSADERPLDVTRCKPGTVICDVARPPTISEADAQLRPDLLIIESGQIRLPGNPEIGFDMGMPPGVVHACLAETILLALEGRFEDFSLGRNLEIERVKEIYGLYKKHGFELAGSRSYDVYLTDADIAHKRRLADELRANPTKLEALVAKGQGALAQEHGRKLLRDAQTPTTRRNLLIGVVSALALLAGSGWLWTRRNRNRSRD